MPSGNRQSWPFEVSFIYRILNNSVRRIGQQGVKRSLAERRELARFFLHGDLHEAATLLGLIYKISCTLRDISAQLFEHAKTLQAGERRKRRIDPASEEGLLLWQCIELISASEWGHPLAASGQ